MNLLRLIFLFFIFIVISIDAEAETKERRSYRYTLSWEETNTFTYRVSLRTQPQKGKFTDFQLPAWRPGRYILQNYAAAVSNFGAYDERGRPLSWTKVDKDTWRVTNPMRAKEIEIRYRFYAGVLDAGSSYLDDQVAYFNGANLFMHVRGLYDVPCTLSVPSLPANWKIATALQKNKDRNLFTMDSYHDFIDCPTVFSPNLVTYEFKVDDFVCYVYFQGKYGAQKGEEKKFLETVGKIVREQRAIFNEIPADEHHFIYLLAPFQIRHAVEHKYCSMYVMPEGVAANEKAFEGLHGITSHEFWHVWNVKSIRPAALWPYDYSKEVYTSLHWFTEGVTDYYTYLILARAGTFTREQFLKQFSQLISNLENSYATQVVSPSASSFDTWLSTSSYVSPHHRTSFYPLGSRMGLLLDMALRVKSNGNVGLDDVFQYLYKHYFQKNKGVPEDGVLKACEEVTGVPFDDFFNNYIDGLTPIDYAQFFHPFGLTLAHEIDKEAPAHQLIGILKMETDAETRKKVLSIKPESDAAYAGLCENDIILTVNEKPASEFDFAGLQLNKETLLKVLRRGQEKNVRVTYTGKDAPRKYEIKVREETDLLKNWLKSKVK